jgi:hypothetical protein
VTTPIGVPHVVHRLIVNHKPSDSALGLEKNRGNLFWTGAGGEPVREWLRLLSTIEDRKQIGVDIKTVEFGWPIGTPVCRPIGDGLYEVPDERAALLCRARRGVPDRGVRSGCISGFVPRLVVSGSVRHYSALQF